MKKLLVPILFSYFGIANASYVENFDPIDASNWSISGGSVQGGGTEFFDGNALRFSGSGIRSVNTVGHDVSTGGDISFRLKLGGPNDTVLFEDVDANEDIEFNYSIDSGTTWINLATIDSEDLLYRDTWGLASFDITGAMVTANTMFQWRQIDHSGPSWDHWAIDNVSISSVPVPAAVWLFGSGLIGLIGLRKKSA